MSDATYNAYTKKCITATNGLKTISITQGDTFTSDFGVEWKVVDLSSHNNSLTPLFLECTKTGAQGWFKADILFRKENRV